MGTGHLTGEGPNASCLSTGGYLMERWVRGCSAQIGCFFRLSGLAMAPFFI